MHIAWLGQSARTHEVNPLEERAQQEMPMNAPGSVFGFKEPTWFLDLEVAKRLVDIGCRQSHQEKPDTARHPDYPECQPAQVGNGRNG